MKISHPTYNIEVDVSDGSYPKFDGTQNCAGIPTDFFYYDGNSDDDNESFIDKNRYQASRTGSGKYRRQVFSSRSNRNISEYSMLASVCEDCPFLSQCFSYAMHNEEYGFWAGTTAEQRGKIRTRLERFFRPTRYEFNDNEVAKLLLAMRKQRDGEV